MANVREVTPEMEALYQAWLNDDLEPECRAVAERLRPWKLYWLPDPGQRVLLHSVDYVGPNRPVTVTIAVLGKYNLVPVENLVFGIDPTKLTECDLPPPGEPVGIIHDTPEAELAFVNYHRRLNGLDALTQEGLEEFRRSNQPGKPTAH